MSAVAIFCHPQNGLSLAGDGVCYDESGRIVSLMSKLGHLAEFDCAYGATGMLGIGEAFANVVRAGYLKDFDDLVANLGAALRLALECTFELHRHTRRRPQTTIAVGGWSPGRERFELYRVSNVDRHQEDGDGNLVREVPAFEPVERDFYVSEGGIDRDLQERFGLTTETNDLRLAARAVCACRSLSGKTIEGDPMIYQAGCFLELAVLTREGYGSRIVHRWPEGIGDRVDPSVGEALPAQVFG